MQSARPGEADGHPILIDVGEASPAVAGSESEGFPALRPPTHAWAQQSLAFALIRFNPIG